MNREALAFYADGLWPSGHTTEELDGAHLVDMERVRLAELLRKGVSLAPYYRERLRVRRLSWLGIPRAEQTPNRMARVLILLDRPKKVKAGYTFEAPCVPQIGGRCYRDGEHTHIYELTFV